MRGSEPKLSHDPLTVVLKKKQESESEKSKKGSKTFESESEKGKKIFESQGNPKNELCKRKWEIKCECKIKYLDSGTEKQ